MRGGWESEEGWERGRGWGGGGKEPSHPLLYRKVSYHQTGWCCAFTKSCCC